MLRRPSGAVFIAIVHVLLGAALITLAFHDLVLASRFRVQAAVALLVGLLQLLPALEAGFVAANKKLRAQTQFFAVLCYSLLVVAALVVYLDGPGDGWHAATVIAAGSLGIVLAGYTLWSHWAKLRRLEFKNPVKGTQVVVSTILIPLGAIGIPLALAPPALGPTVSLDLNVRAIDKTHVDVQGNVEAGEGEPDLALADIFEVISFHCDRSDKRRTAEVAYGNRRLRATQSGVDELVHEKRAAGCWPQRVFTSTESISPLSRLPSLSATTLGGGIYPRTAHSLVCAYARLDVLSYKPEAVRHRTQFPQPGVIVDRFRISSKSWLERLLRKPPEITVRWFSRNYAHVDHGKRVIAVIDDIKTTEEQISESGAWREYASSRCIQ